jgi:hypothetical protein
LSDATGAQFVSTARLAVIPARQPAATQRPALRECQSPCVQAQLLGSDYDLGLPDRVRLWTHWKLSAAGSPLTVTIVNAANQPMAAPRVLPVATGSAEYFSLPFDVPPERALRARVGEQIVAIPDYRSGERYVPFGNQMALIGVRYAHGLVTSNIDLTWLGARPINDDYAVSVRLTGTRLNEAHDGVPALGAVPTLKWLPGMRIVDRHPIRTDDSSGPFSGRVVVYDTVTRLPLEMLDERYDTGFVFAAQ